MNRAEADEALTAAIKAHADAYEMQRESLLMNWAVVSVWLPPQPEGADGTTGYATHFLGGAMPRHEIAGLATILRESADWDEDE